MRAVDLEQKNVIIVHGYSGCPMCTASVCSFVVVLLLGDMSEWVYKDNDNWARETALLAPVRAWMITVAHQKLI